MTNKPTLSPVTKVAVFGVAEYGIQNALLEPLEELEVTPLEELLDELEDEELLEDELVEDPELLDEEELLDDELLEDEDELVELDPLGLLLELPPHPARRAESSTVLMNGAPISVPRAIWVDWRMSLAPYDRIP